jgi:methylthioribose-1-phosphate isomerase
MSAMKKPSLLERLRAKKKTKSTVVGVTWYTEENWNKVKAAATDPERFEETYAEWSGMAIEAVADLKKTGVNAVKVLVIQNEFLPWCLAHNKPNNAASRAEFVSEKLRSQSEADA